MCASCGCGKPDDQHGDDRHITGKQIQAAASAAGVTPQEVAMNMLQSVQQEMGAAHQPSGEATVD
jgi:hypothetical protein